MIIIKLIPITNEKRNGLKFERISMRKLTSKVGWAAQRSEGDDIEIHLHNR